MPLFKCIPDADKKKILIFPAAWNAALTDVQANRQEIQKNALGPAPFQSYLTACPPKSQYFLSSRAVVIGGKEKKNFENGEYKDKANL